MLGLAWSLLAGLPVGALAGWTLAGPGAASVAIGAAAGGLGLAAGVHLLARLSGAAPTRLAAAAGLGWCALPALGACWLRLAPAPAWWLAGVLLALAAALAAASGGIGPLRRLPSAALAVGAGTLGAVAVSALAAAWGAPGVVFDEARAAAVYDMDAEVATLPIPRCSPAPARVEVLLERGARPRASADGERVWFDADVAGRRQIHSLERASGDLFCWTCGERGNNLRPAPGLRAVVFETDRWASGWDPTNTEIHLLSTRAGRPRHPSRRLTYAAGPDDHALLRDGGIVVWSQRRDGRYQVVSARLRSGHGGLSLSSTALLAGGGAAWTAPLAWSPDARSLVVARGNPLGPPAASGIDFASGRQLGLGDSVAGGGAASFNADGGWLVVASAEPARLAGLLPGGLGALLAPLAAALERGGPLYRGSELRVGEPWGEGARLELGEVAAWGAPTGVSLVPGEPRIVLGQSRRSPDAVEERLVQITLDCAAASARPRER